MNQYQILKIIGQGAFGNAYLAKHLSEDKSYVIKKIELNNKTEQQTQNIFNEVKLLAQFKHVNIVSYRQSIIDGQWLNIVMEFCAGGDLNELIVEQKQNQGGKKLDQKTIIDWAVQIALAIFYMHDKRILHRDLKTPNIFITDDKVKLGDFGISKVLDEKIDLASTSIGTPYYMSPQQYKHKPYSYKSDIWAFGCILYEMCNQKRPFEAFSLNGLAVKVLQANFAPVSQFYSKQLRQIIKKMLQKKEKDRPTILQFLQTPIIRKRVITYIKQVYDKFILENGDKILMQGVLYQAKKLGIVVQQKKQSEQQKKNKPEFSAEKKRQQKQRIRQQLQQQLKKMSEKNKSDRQKLKKLQQDRKNVLKGHASHRASNSASKKSGLNSNSSKSIKEHSLPSESTRTHQSNIQKSKRAKRFKIQEDYDMYDMQYEQQDSQDDDKKLFEVIHQDDQEDNQKEPRNHQPVKPYQKEKYSNSQLKEIEKNTKSKFTQISQAKVEDQLPIEEAIVNLKQSLKMNNQKLNTIKNQLSNMDFTISSSSEDQFEKTMEKYQLPIMKKRQKNPAHVAISDKINDLRQNLQVIIKKEEVERLINLCRQRKANTTKAEIQKITGPSNIGTYLMANQIIKLTNVIDKIPIYVE